MQCIDVNKMEPVWLRYVNDGTDSTLVLEEESENIAYLYTACEVDLRAPEAFAIYAKSMRLRVRWSGKSPLNVFMTRTLTEGHGNAGIRRMR